MAGITKARMRPSRWASPLAAIVAVGAVAAAAALAPGYDAQETPRLDTGVWVTRDDGLYARVNTELGEIDTTRSVASPEGIVQSGSRGLVFTQHYVQAWPIDGAHPADLISSALSDTNQASAANQVIATPNGTSFAASAGPFVVYLTATGEVHLGTMPDGSTQPSSARHVDPFADVITPEGQEPPRYVAQAVAIDAEGNLAMYSAAEGGVRRFSSSAGKFVGDIVNVPQAPEQGNSLMMTIVDGQWVLLSASTGTMWIEGHGSTASLDIAGDALLQTGASDHGSVLVADSAGLVEVTLKDATVTRVSQVDGVPASPIVVDGVSYAAWVNTTEASMWSSATGEIIPLEIDAQALARQRSIAPVFRSNGDRAVLTETVTGLLWTVPDGKLIPLSAWADADDGEQKEGTIQVDDVIEQEPPVANPDSFGVRSGAVVALSLLLNDSDPNKKDVLTIDPALMTGLADPEFGSLSLVNQQQQAVIHVNASEGTSTFTYAASDGIQSSPATTVTLTVVPDDVNTAPTWCPDEACTQAWPAPQVAPGGFVSVAALNGWVDAEGDVVLLIDARADDPNAPVSVVPTSDGHVVIRHLDPNASEATIPVTITVADARGAQTTEALDVRVTATPALTVKPVAVSSGAANPVKIKISDYVSGGSGSYRLVDATATQGSEEAFTVSPSAANGMIELVATDAGRFAATYTIEDTATLVQMTAVIRLSVPQTASALALPPLTAFVRSGEDTTIDVLTTANSTTGRVLMVSGAVSDDPDLSVSVVGGALVRVSATSTSAQPGSLGVANVTVSDGAGNATTTQLTVFLLSASHGVGPVAAPDAVSVRAGTQVDVPVLANDVSPRGERIILHPDIQGSGTTGELAFASGSTLRYLAPKTPGVYVVRYSVFLESDPGRIDEATLTVSVLPEGSNKAPQPPVLIARVLAGHSITIPLNLAGIDPDGDPVMLADASQPDHGQGTVTVNAQGDAIVYRAPEGGVPGGQVSFNYTVRDPDGSDATGTVKVGVFDLTQTDVAPITYADYLSARISSPTLLTVQPLLNDRDPQQGVLEIIKIVPNADPESPEYAVLESLIDSTTSLKDGKVFLHAGDVEGPHSYRYTVQSGASFSTAEGLIVIGVSDAPAPDSLTVLDTVVTAKTRGDLAGGIDVVTGKVVWPTGDPSNLKLEIWGDGARGFVASGHVIKGVLPEKRTLVPFSLTGQDLAGDDITTYGFLRIPALDEMRLQATPGVAAIEVPEDTTASINVRERLDIGPRDTIEIRDTDSYPVQRDNARCMPDSATTVSYVAGREAPWHDTCSIGVRLVGQETWSIVPVPITIVPKDPQAILSPISRTITPGQKDSVDILADLVSWEGGRKGDTKDLTFSMSTTGPSFEVSQTGSAVAIQAVATARPGTRETVTVSTSAFGGLTTTITLVVGAALDELPKGATFSSQCDVSKSGSCLITAVGLASEFDPYAGAPGAGLHLASVGTGDSVVCSVATVTRASDTQLVANWPSGQRPVGGECVVDFTVVDAQGGKGPGQVTIDVLGFPQTPASITTDSYTESSVTLLVALGQAAQAHPAVSSVAIYEGGNPTSADCQASGPGSYRCLLSGLTNGEKHSYTARAVNSVGESLDTTAVGSWAYQAPKITALSATPEYDPVRTSQGQGVVTVTVSGGDDIDHFIVENSGTSIGRTGASSQGNVTIPVGLQLIAVTPVSKFQPPISGDNRGTARTTSVEVAGSPSYPSAASAPETGTTVVISSSELDQNHSTRPSHQLWMAWTSDTPTCTMTEGGAPLVTGRDVVTSTTPRIESLTPNTDYFISVCGTNGYGAAMAPAGSILTWDPPAAPAGPLTFTVDTAGTRRGDSVEYRLTGTTSLSVPDKFTAVYLYDGVPRNDGQDDTLGLRFDRAESIDVKFCLRNDPARCGDSTEVRRATAPTIVSLSTPGLGDPGCWPAGSESRFVFSPVVNNDASRSVGVEVIGSQWRYTVTWLGEYSALDSLTFDHDKCADPDPSPEPSPTPSP